MVRDFSGNRRLMFLNIRDLYREYASLSSGNAVEISGWVRTNRASKAFGFIELNDGTFFRSVQVVYEKAFLENFEEISRVLTASAVTVRGIVELTPEGKQPFEIKARSAEVEALSDPSYPLQKKRHSMEFLREIAHLRPRSNTFSAVFRVRSLLAYAVHKFFQERGFVYVHTPIITGSDAEGAGEMFHVTSFNLGKLPRSESGAVDYSRDFFENRRL